MHNVYTHTHTQLQPHSIIRPLVYSLAYKHFECLENLAEKMSKKEMFKTANTKTISNFKYDELNMTIKAKWRTDIQSPQNVITFFLKHTLKVIILLETDVERLGNKIWRHRERERAETLWIWIWNLWCIRCCFWNWIIILNADTI